jgi:hypothetical protein
LEEPNATLGQWAWLVDDDAARASGGEPVGSLYFVEQDRRHRTHVLQVVNVEGEHAMVYLARELRRSTELYVARYIEQIDAYHREVSEAWKKIKTEQTPARGVAGQRHRGGRVDDGCGGRDDDPCRRSQGNGQTRSLGEAWRHKSVCDEAFL